jgi:excisionase family DNA binding protein
MPDSADGLLTVAELAAYLGVPQQTIYRWNHTGDGPPPLKVGRHRRYRRRDVERWLDRMSAEGRRGA